MIDESLLLSPFNNNQNSYWHCPTCDNGYLIVEKDTLISRQSNAFQLKYQYNECEPESINLVYSCIFRCSNNNCKEVVTSSGTGYLDWGIIKDENDNFYEGYAEYFNPKYFYPPIKIINLPKSLPENVAAHLDKSFELFFSSPSAAVNHIRCALELILSHLGVPRYTNSKGKRKILNLHQRIERSSQKNPELKEYLLAIKWVGNNGSHAEKKLIKNDLVDLYEILEHVLFEIFNNKSKIIFGKAQKINKAKGIK